MAPRRVLDGIGRHITALLALAALAAPAVCAQYNADEGTRVLGYGEYIGVEIENTDAGSIDIIYEVSVDPGPAVGVFFMEDTDYADVQAQRGFEYYIVYSVEDTRHVKREWTWSDKGVFYVVIINLNASHENATVTYSVGHEETPTGSSLVLWVLGAVIVIVIVIGSFVLLRRRGKGTGAATTQIGYGAPVAPEGLQQPPPGPYPPPPQMGPYPPPPRPGT